MATGPWVVLSVILGILLIIMIIYNAIILTQRIDPSMCPTVGGQFGVQAGQSAAILSQCGTDQSSPCNFTNLATLSAAVNQCNQLFTICQRFMYFPDSASMSIADPKSSITTLTTSDLYTRQTGTN